MSFDDLAAMIARSAHTDAARGLTYDVDAVITAARRTVAEVLASHPTEGDPTS